MAGLNVVREECPNRAECLEAEGTAGIIMVGRDPVVLTVDTLYSLRDMVNGHSKLTEAMRSE